VVPKAGELKVLSFLATGIPESAALFELILSCTKVTVDDSSKVCPVGVRNTPSTELESIQIVVSPG
jgi:hypothetical protein